MASDGLAKAREKRAEIISINGTIERLTPLEKAQQNPKSLRLAINAKCYDCGGEDADPGWRGRITECVIPECPLFPVRPYQKKDNS